jgi:signal transduction histidine kinase
MYVKQELEEAIQLSDSNLLSRHDHPCLIYDSLDELAGAFVPYLRSGLALGERCIYFINENSEQFVVDSMQAGNFDLQPYIRSGAFSIINTKDAHLKDGYFEEKKMLAYWLSAIAAAREAGFTGLRAAVEMTWALSGCPGCEILAPYESRLNHFTSTNDLTVVCQYRRQKFAPQQIKDVINAHPIVISNNEVLHNTNFINPQYFVEGDAELELQAMLDNLALIHRLQQRTAELAAARDQAVQASILKSQFVSNISHEIRTPMNGVIGALELLATTDPDSNMTKELVDTAYRSARSLMSVVTDLLDFSKLEAGKVTLESSEFYIVSVLDTVIESVSIAAKRKGLVIREEVDDALREKLLIGDVRLIRRVLLNLIDNAVKFTEEGSIQIQVQTVQETGNSITLRTTVTDSGIGIAQADVSKLFQPFVQADGSNTRKHSGTGLGLSITQGYVTLMGGEIGFTSQEQHGSSFWFTLPLTVCNPS